MKSTTISAGVVNLHETLTMAVDSVWSHKFRSGLTILGIVIGITTVVTVSSRSSASDARPGPQFRLST